MKPTRSDVILKTVDQTDNGVAPEDCLPTCYAYRNNGNDPTNAPASKLGYIGLDGGIYGSGMDFTNMMFIEEVGGTTNGTFSMDGKRLFAADPSQANPPAIGEYFPAQAIYASPSVSLDDQGNLWTFFGTGDRNHPLNGSTNRFYGIKDDTTIDDGVTLTESDLLEIDSSVSTVSTSIQGWYFTLGANEKVLAAADIFNHMVFFSTFTPDTTALCGSGGGTARLYAVEMLSGMAALDFDTGEKLTSTSGAALRSTVIGTGIPSKPAVMVDPYGNPSVITGTTSQQISSQAVPNPAIPRLLGWREVF